MALPAILGASRAVLSGSKLARTANIGSKLLGRKKKDPPGQKPEVQRILLYKNRDPIRKPRTRDTRGERGEERER